MHASDDLHDRILNFIVRRPPSEVNYVRGSLSEVLLANYAANGPLDAQGLEMLDICQYELEQKVAESTGATREYFGECLALVNEVLAAHRSRGK